jgi:hypothetical protein
VSKTNGFCKLKLKFKFQKQVLFSLPLKKVMKGVTLEVIGKRILSMEVIKSLLCLSQVKKIVGFISTQLKMVGRISTKKILPQI